MGDSKIQPGVRLSEDVWREFREDVAKRCGSVKGNLSRELETVIQRHLEASNGGDLTDEIRRLREQVEDLGGGEPSESDGGSERDSVSTTTEKRIDEIMSDVQDRADELGSARVREEDVEAAIERNAGASYKTIQRYKKLLQNQRELFAHPDLEDVYFVRPSAFIAFVEQGVAQPTADEIRGAYGDEWWVEHAPDGMIDEGDRGFQ